MIFRKINKSRRMNDMPFLDEASCEKKKKIKDKK